MVAAAATKEAVVVMTEDVPPLRRLKMAVRKAFPFRQTRPWAL
jgi:hypothetical protein